MRRIALIALTTMASADTLLLKDGTVVEGTVVAVVVETASGRRALEGAEIDWDRARTDAAWIEANLRFALARDAKSKGSTAVYLGRGVFPPSAKAVVRRLDGMGLAPRLLFEEQLTAAGLAGLRVLVVPGGWAPTQHEAMGDGGRGRLRTFVEAGGAYLGICAGAYVACSAVSWEDREYPYALGLARGRAIGPVKGLAPWPTTGSVEIRAGGHAVPALYAGGCSLAIDGAAVLATYPDGSAAAIEVRLGKGRVFLCGVHPEFVAADRDLLAGWADGSPPGDGDWLEGLLRDASR